MIPDVKVHMYYHLRSWITLSPWIFIFLGIKLTEGDQELYKNFPLVISERWQAEVADTVFDTINHDYDKIEQKKKAKAKKVGGNAQDEKDSDCILHGYVKKQGGPFGTAWQTRYAKLYPNRLELHSENNKPELTFMDQIEEINTGKTKLGRVNMKILIL